MLKEPGQITNLSVEGWGIAELLHGAFRSVGSSKVLNRPDTGGMDYSLIFILSMRLKSCLPFLLYQHHSLTCLVMCKHTYTHGHAQMHLRTHSQT